MTLDELKLAAKRLRKQSLPGADALTHSQALDLVSKIHGFRDYHEAQQRLTTKSILDAVAAEPGGLLSAERTALSVSPIILGWKESICIAGPSGSGKSMAVMELVIQALQDNRPVRILDSGGSYHRFVQLLGGQYFNDVTAPEAYEAWQSNAPLVCIDAWDTVQASWVDFEKLKTTSSRPFLVIDEVWQFKDVYKDIRADEQLCLYVVQAEKDLDQVGVKVTRRILFDRTQPARLSWTMPTAIGSITFKGFVGPKRLAVFTTNPTHVKELGTEVTPELLASFEEAIVSKLRD